MTTSKESQALAKAGDLAVFDAKGRQQIYLHSDALRATATATAAPPPSAGMTAVMASAAVEREPRGRLAESAGDNPERGAATT
jgi:hypothetical protein